MKRIIAVITFAVFSAPALAQNSPVDSAAVAEGSRTPSSAARMEPTAERTELTFGYFDPAT
jgi:hypothetical protein